MSDSVCSRGKDPSFLEPILLTRVCSSDLVEKNGGVPTTSLKARVYDEIFDNRLTLPGRRPFTLLQSANTTFTAIPQAWVRDINLLLCFSVAPLFHLPTKLFLPLPSPSLYAIFGRFSRCQEIDTDTSHPCRRQSLPDLVCNPNDCNPTLRNLPSELLDLLVALNLQLDTPVQAELPRDIVRAE